jgi:tRNA nucleotidyltransferase (CCA-adding enzyme)
MNKKSKNFSIYLVGGAVRDQLLGLPVHERDWVVVGSSPEEMLAQGFRPVGKEFPVFLHPKTQEEYALARTERKVGKGYKGFTFYTSPEVTLEEDLKRRDLTINAMALSDQKELIDPFNGQSDLQSQILRHVSQAFMEDPVRILRIARFAAKLPTFRVAEETNQFMQQMVSMKEVDALVSERVWQEVAKALEENAPERFFEVLADCHALNILFPEIQLHSLGMRALPLAVKKNLYGPERFAVLLHESAQNIQGLCRRLKVPLEYSELARLVADCFPVYQQITHAPAEEILKLIKSTDALRRPERFQHFLATSEVCLQVREGQIPNPSPTQILNASLQAIQAIDIQPLLEQGLKGKEMGDAITALQLEALKAS